jgi:hypothetical protein
MPVESRDSDAAGLETSRIMLGMLVLLAADRDERVDESPPRRSELVLADAGFTAQEIAKLTGRNHEAVRSSLRRHAQPKTNATGRAK